MDSKDKDKIRDQSRIREERERVLFAVDDLALKSCIISSATAIHGGIHKVQPSVSRWGNRISLLIGSDKVLEAHVEPEILLWSILENVICHHGV